MPSLVRPGETSRLQRRWLVRAAAVDDDSLPVELARVLFTNQTSSSQIIGASRRLGEVAAPLAGMFALVEYLPATPL